jgi:hypothetical protein
MAVERNGPGPAVASATLTTETSAHQVRQKLHRSWGTVLPVFSSFPSA